MIKFKIWISRSEVPRHIIVWMFDTTEESLIWAGCVGLIKCTGFYIWSIGRVMYFKKKQVHFIVLFTIRVLSWGKYHANKATRCQTRLDYILPTWDRSWVKLSMCPLKFYSKHQQFIKHICLPCVIFHTKYEETHQGWFLRIKNLLDQKKEYFLQDQKEKESVWVK